MKNTILNEDIVQARIVNTQTVDFNDWCVRMANGSTVTAADVAAVMQQIEDKLPEILSLNAKVICSPAGLIFRPKVSGSITKSELKARLVARKAAETDPEKAAKINVDRELTTSDLSISDCTKSIEVVLPKIWSTIFDQRATLKRVGKGVTDDSESSDEEGNDNVNENNGGSSTPTNPVLTINRSGTGTATVSVGGNAVNSGAEIAANTEVSISVTPAAGATPTATLNGNSLALTENGGVYTGSFTMPSANATLSINTGGNSGGSDQN